MRGFILASFAIVCPLLALEPPSQSRPSLWPRPSPQPTIQQEVDKRPFTKDPTGAGLRVDGANVTIASNVKIPLHTDIEAL